MITPTKHTVKFTFDLHSLKNTDQRNAIRWRMFFFYSSSTSFLFMVFGSFVMKTQATPRKKKMIAAII
jgi:phage-related protein